jgi:hypothetical protein
VEKFPEIPEVRQMERYLIVKALTNHEKKFRCDPKGS